MTFYTTFFILIAFLTEARAAPFSMPAARGHSDVASLISHSSNLNWLFVRNPPVHPTECPTNEAFTCCCLGYINVVALNKCVCRNMRGKDYDGFGMFRGTANYQFLLPWSFCVLYLGVGKL